jgi:lipoyl(octanoyl) transferase
VSGPLQGGPGPAVWRWLGRAPFAAVAREQERLRAEVLVGAAPETLLFCEHEPVITLGRSAGAADLLVPAAELARRDIDVIRATRGGAATYHGPGQLVGYPIVRLRSGVVGHVQAMARAVGATLAELGIEAAWRRDAPGLWINDEKICAFGVHVHRRVAIHGFALNVTADLERFRLIVPCGMREGRATSIRSVRARLFGDRAPAPALHLLATRVALHLGHALGISFIPNILRPVGDSSVHPHRPRGNVEMWNRITRMIEA